MSTELRLLRLVRPYWGLLAAGVVVTFVASDISKPPDSVRQLSRSTAYRSVAVGPCFSKTEKYPSGAWWVIVALYR